MLKQDENGTFHHLNHGWNFEIMAHPTLKSGDIVTDVWSTDRNRSLKSTTETVVVDQESASGHAFETTIRIVSVTDVVVELQGSRSRAFGKPGMNDAKILCPVRTPKMYDRSDFQYREKNESDRNPVMHGKPWDPKEW